MCSFVPLELVKLAVIDWMTEQFDNDDVLIKWAQRGSK